MAVGSCLSMSIVSYVVRRMSDNLAGYVSSVVGRFNVSIVGIGNEL